MITITATILATGPYGIQHLLERHLPRHAGASGMGVGGDGKGEADSRADEESGTADGNFGKLHGHSPLKLGPKWASGDEKTPEGEYHVLDHRTSGKFNYIPALYLDYPNATDRSASKALGVDPEGDILIHGPPKAMLGMHPPGNWTDGCIALSRTQMGLIMSVSKVGTRVEIVP